ncbi:RNA polymerase sigma factor [Dyadobacter fermentans]|uniref:RNA polymerase sigma factor n=1 Tax=Dyadobacter fermentans TaxID=94254 RepID=UPI001CBAE255|nr:sigma-70 family RNA polymerase sigma factor [Dyadobacter fermentans]MBZ1358037.1 sigma-70 family RNA polymerase sigma factor [Dyadobacter fermentans]
MSDNERVRDQQLLEALCAGQEWAFTAVYDEYWYPMYKVAFHKIGQRHVAEEIVQDIFTRLWNERANLRTTTLNYYLFSAVRFEVIDHIRKAGPRSRYAAYYQAFASQHEHYTEDEVAYNELLRSIDEGLKPFPAQTREMFKLSRVESWTVAQIAEFMNLSEKTVEYHLGKASKAVREYLSETLLLLLVSIFS